MSLLKLAARNLSRNRRRTLISLVALIIGMGAMVAVRGVINGVQKGLFANLVDGQLGAIQVHRAGFLANVLASPLTLDMADTPELRQKILAVPGVKAVAPRIQFGAMLGTPDAPQPEGADPTAEIPADQQGKTSFFLATAIDPAFETKVTPRRSDLLSRGRLLEASEAREVVLNNELAEGLGVEVVRGALPPEERWASLIAVDRDGSMNGELVVAAGTVGAGTPGDKKYGSVPLALAQRLLRMEGRVTEYALSVERLDDAPRIRDALAAALGPEYEVHTWDQVFPFLKSITGTQDFVFGIIIAIFLVVVLLGIVNSMLMNVLERVREIGTMLAVGMRRRQVTLLFLVEGALLGALGGVIGVGLGVAGVLYMNSQGLPLAAPGAAVPMIVRPVVSTSYVAFALTLAALGSGLASLYPAMRASALRPVEALQSV